MKSALQGSNIAILKGTGKAETHASRQLAKARIGNFARALLTYHVSELLKSPDANQDSIQNLIDTIERVVLGITGNARFGDPANGRIFHYELDTQSETLTARHKPIEHVTFTDDMISIYPGAIPSAVMNRLIADGPARDEYGKSITRLSSIIDIPLPGYDPQIIAIGRYENRPDTPLVLSTPRDEMPWLEVTRAILSRERNAHER